MKILSSLVVLSALVAAASAQNQNQQGTPAPTTVAPTKGPTTPTPTKGPTTPAPTKGPATPAPTTKAPESTPAPTTAKPVSTPAASTTKPAATPAATSTSKYDPIKGCWSVSVERDATYCIAGPICSGSGDQPAGWNCPKKDDVAIERCLPYLKSYTSPGKCVAPVDAECKVIHTGAWGCVLKGDSSTGGDEDRGGKVTHPPTHTNGTVGGNTTTNSTVPGKSDNGTIQAPTKLTNLAGVEAGSSSAAVVGTVAAVAAVAAAVIGAVLYKKNQSKAAASNDTEEIVEVVTP